MRKLCLFLTIFSAFYLFSQNNTPTPVRISNSPEISRDVSVAININNEVCAVWTEEYGASSKITFFSIRRGTSWSAPAAIPGQSGHNKEPFVSRGRNGAGFICVWNGVSAEYIMFTEWTGSSWTTPYAVSDKCRSTYGLFGYPKVTATTNGRIVVAWSNATPNSATSDIYARIWNNGWGSITNISNTAKVSKVPDIAPGIDGSAYVVWQESLSTVEKDQFEAQWNINDASGRWLGAQLITNTGMWFFRPVIGVNPNNDVMVTYFYQQAAGYFSSFRVNNYWTAPQRTTNWGIYLEHDHYFADICPYDKGFLVIARDGGNNTVYRTAAKGNLGSTNVLSRSGATRHPAIDYSPLLGAVAAWSEVDSSNDVFAVVFTPGENPDEPPPPPDKPPVIPEKPVLAPTNVAQETRRIEYTVANVNVESIENRNVFTVQYINKVTWGISAVLAQYKLPATKYKLFRRLKGKAQWVLLKEVNAPTQEYLDKDNVNPVTPYEYYVLAVDDAGSTAYQYNRISWQNNPKNIETGVKVMQYHIYRKVPGIYDFGGWRKVSSGVFGLEDASVEIRYGTRFEYAVAAIDDKGKESPLTPAKIN